jgi:hypoxanthine phosphoribosyltransferase
MKTKNGKIYIEWDDYQQIVQNNTCPDADYIVGISRGGLIPATILSHALDCKMIPLMFSTRDHEYIDQNTITHLNNLLARGNKLLIVDDIIDSGKTFNMLNDMLKPTKLGQIKWTAIVANTDAKMNMGYDFCWALPRSKDDRWVVFPYEVDSV